MKIAYKFFIVITSVFLFFSCAEGDVFTGSPQDSNVESITLTGTIATTETSVISSQRVPVTITLPQSFPVDVNVQATAFIANTNRRSTRTILIPAGQTTVVDYVTVPGADISSMPFSMTVTIALTGITTAAVVDVPLGFEGKQYTLTSNVLSLEYGDTVLPAANSKRLGIRFDFKGPKTGEGTNNNELNIVVKKNGIALLTNNFAIASSLTAPLASTLQSTSTTGAKSLYFLDIAQKLKISNRTVNDSINGVYTVRSSNTTALNYKVGDEVSLENFNGSGSAPLVVQVASVPDAFSFTFNYTGTHLFTPNNSFAQPVFAPQGNWSPFLAYAANNSAVYNGVTYYALHNVAANLVGNPYPNMDSFNWASGILIPKINWSNAFTNPPTYAANTAYSVNSVVKHNNVVYLSKAEFTSPSGAITTSNSPAGDTTRWTPAIIDYLVDVTNWNSTDTYEISIYAKTLNGSTTPGTPVDLPYKFALRYPDGSVKVFSGIATNLVVGPASSAIPKLQIVKTTAAGVSSYVVTYLP